MKGVCSECQESVKIFLYDGEWRLETHPNQSGEICLGSGNYPEAIYEVITMK